MTIQNRIDTLYTIMEDAVNRLSVADNHWSFTKVPERFAFYAFNHGHKEALIQMEVNPAGDIVFKVIDVGIIRFVDGTNMFQFTMDPKDMTEEEEDAYLDLHLIHVLNVKHGIN